ncbi:MAG: hypothetical protein AAFO81_10040 [Pseudomonadota bacterium]
MIKRFLTTITGCLLLTAAGCATPPSDARVVSAPLLAPCHTVEEFDVTTYGDALYALSVLSDELARCDARMAALRAQLTPH